MAQQRIPVTNLSGVRTRVVPDLDIPHLPGALCKGVDDPDMFFPGPGAGGRKKRDQARAICAQCPVQQACLDYALDWDMKHPDYFDRIQGIWGGTSEAERKRMLKESQKIGA